MRWIKSMLRAIKLWPFHNMDIGRVDDYVYLLDFPEQGYWRCYIREQRIFRVAKFYPIESIRKY